MRRLKLIGTAMIAILVLSAVTASTAVAKPEFLDNAKGNKIAKGTGPAGELTTLGGGISIACGENLVTGETTGAEEGTLNVNFKKCTALGAFKANSLGDAEGTVLTGTVKFKLCYINESLKEVGLYLEGLNIHVEEPSLGVLINLTGSIIGKITPINSLKTGPYTLAFTQSAAGDPSFVKCSLLGQELKASFLSSKDAKHEKNESTALKLTDEITFEKDVEIMA